MELKKAEMRRTEEFPPAKGLFSQRSSRRKAARKQNHHQTRLFALQADASLLSPRLLQQAHPVCVMMCNDHFAVHYVVAGLPTGTEFPAFGDQARDFNLAGSHSSHNRNVRLCCSAPLSACQGCKSPFHGAADSCSTLHRATCDAPRSKPLALYCRDSQVLPSSFAATSRQPPFAGSQMSRYVERGDGKTLLVG